MDVLILAAGLGSRLSTYTHDIIPKYLINIDTHTGLYYIINYWKKYANNIYLVIHSKYYPITQYYINNILTEDKDKIILIEYNESNGTAITLSNILNDQLLKYNIKNLLITWCDIYPTDTINFTKLKARGKNNIFVFTNGNKCRYKLDNKNNILYCPITDGNIIGIYYFHNFKTFNLDNSVINTDIVIYLSKIGKVHNYSVSNIVDFGDEDKLIDIINKNNIDKNNIKCRYFNNITIIDNDKLLKKAIDDKGRSIIKYEKEWYKYIINKNHNLEYIPKIYEYYEFGYLMEYKKDYIPLYEYFNKYYGNNTNENNDNSDNKNNQNNKNRILDNVMDKLNNLHKIETRIENKNIFFNNIKKEIYDKVITRVKNIEEIINYFGEIQYVNCTKIVNLEVVLEKCKNIITSYYNTLNKFEYNIIFGDCNFSNILINPNNIDDIVFIDPRGYFGDTTVFGLTDYDYSKILYAISGYDNFNSKFFNINSINVDNKSIEFDIIPIQFDKKYIDKYFNKVHKAFMVIHWLSLAEYNKNNIWKCLTSYYYGLYLGTLL